MFCKQLILLIISLSCLLAESNPAIVPDDSHVIKLSSLGITNFLSDNSLVLIEFFAPWCGHCKNLGPELQNAAELLQGKDIKIAQVDCTKDDQFCKDMGIRSYPTLNVVKGGDLSQRQPYTGQRTSSLIVNYMIKSSLPLVMNFNSTDELRSVVRSAGQTVILQLNSNGDTVQDIFHEVAQDLNEKFVFGQLQDDEFNSRFNNTDIKYIVYRSNKKDEEYPMLSHNDTLTVEELRKFIISESMPLFGEINGSTFKSYNEANLPIAYFFYWEPEEKEIITPLILKLAQEHRGMINFVLLDARKYGMHATNLNMKEEFPLFAIHDITTNLKYGMDQSRGLHIKDMQLWVSLFIDGSLEPNLKSEPVPEEQTQLLKLVGKTHDEIVNDDTKTTLVLYTTNSCTLCPELITVFEELADLVLDDKSFNIATINLSVNDIRMQLKSIPTSILYRPHTEPMRYEGAYDTDTLVQFLGYHGKYKRDEL